mmetsp:Transcript_36339/g.74047  ORF Transcript_36339/g.74047 Transcript_36339/m.74047 type:complete len:1130 (-) Transcript_36339:43-3432(-)
MTVAINDDASHVRVGVRIRPLTPKESSEGGKEIVDTNTFNRTVELSKRKFTYDNIFPTTINNVDLYNNVAPPLLNAFLNGFNATVLAYGQTGSGKTYTMGSEAHTANWRDDNILNDNDGLIPRFISGMFQSLIQRREEAEKALLQSVDGDKERPASSLVDFQVSASFLEVYGEDIYDLLVDESRTPLKLREGTNKEVVVKGLRNKSILNAAEAMNVLSTGTMNRTTASTLMNRTSSRSHAVFMLNLRQTTRSAEGVDVTSTSRFTFVDLAGSERMKKTGAEGERAKEGIKINEGLLALGNVINALADEDRIARGEKVHVPYRQTKLTRLLQDALGGNSQTLFLACVSPSDTNASETLSTLQYANRARNIKNAPTRNVDETAVELQRLHAMNNLLKRELVRQRFGPEMQRTNEDIGNINDKLLLREDVAAYLNLVDEKVCDFGNVPNLPTLASDFRPHSAPASIRPVIAPVNEVSSSDDGENDEGDSDMSDSEVNPHVDMQIVDELIESSRQDQTPSKDDAAREQIENIDNEIETHEDRLLQLKEHLKGYHNMKEKYDNLLREVENLEAEKHSLAKQLEQAQVDPTKGCSVTIKKQLDRIKSSLERARSESRKHQQLYRKAEKEAQKCKVLERKISEAKTTKMHLMKKQKEDAKKQKEFTKTKTREIQRLRLQERTAMKEVSKLKSENQRLKANLKRSKARCEKLSEQSKQTELSLARVLANRAKGNGTPRNGDMDCMGQFASMTEELSSLSFVLEKALENKVDISRNKQMYDEKVAEREKLELSMSAEVVLLKEKKTKRKEFGSEPPEDVICEVRDCQDNIQELSLKIELLENDIGLIRENYPSVEDEDYGCADAFDTQDSALMVLSKQSSPALRTLIVKLLTSCHDSELGRRNLLDSKARDDSTLSNLRNELVLKNERIDALSKTLERQRQNFQVGSEVKDNKYKQLENEAKVTNAQLDSCVADKAKLLLELERARELLSLSQESNAKLEGKVADKAKLVLELERARKLLSLSQESNAKLEGQLASLESQRVRNETSQVIGQSETKMISKRPPSPASRGYVFVETDSVTPKEATIKPTSSQGAQSSVKKLVVAYSATSKETQQSPNRPLSKMPFGLKHTFKGVMNRNK